MITGGADMRALSRRDVLEMLGELDDVTVANVIATGATLQELAEAHAWLTNDEALINAGKHLPSGRVGQLVEIIAAKEREEEQQEEPAKQMARAVLNPRE
jgi:hypothetical protein